MPAERLPCDGVARIVFPNGEAPAQGLDHELKVGSMTPKRQAIAIFLTTTR